MYQYHLNKRSYEFEDINAMRKSAYGHLTYEGMRIPIVKDGEQYGFAVLLDDGVWMYTESDRQYRRVRPSGTVA